MNLIPAIHRYDVILRSSWLFLIIVEWVVQYYFSQFLSRPDVIWIIFISYIHFIFLFSKQLLLKISIHVNCCIIMTTLFDFPQTRQAYGWCPKTLQWKPHNATCDLIPKRTEFYNNAIPNTSFLKYVKGQ